MRRKLIFLAIFTFLAVLDISARAGGGGGYGGGGGGGGGFGGGGGGGGGGIEIILFLIRLIIDAPVIGIPLAIAILAALYFAGKKGVKARQGRLLRVGQRCRRANEKAKNLNKLKAADPLFSETVFLKRVEQAFFKIQSAWCAQDLDPVCPFISDGIHERFTLQIEEQKADNFKDHMESIRVRKMFIAQAATDESYDTLTVRIRASAVDYRVSLKSGARLSGSPAPETFVEYWSFLRCRGVQSLKDGKGLIEGHCPNCGAKISMNQFAKCTYCKALLKSGAYDWVLAEITQESEWISTLPEEVAGVAEYREEKDRHFNLQHLEDRASIMFWRFIMAKQKGSPAPLASIATPEFLARFKETLHNTSDRGRRYYKECAVGSVVTRGVLPGEQVDQVLVEIRWSAVPWRVLGDETPSRCGGKKIRTHVMVLQRKAGVISNKDHGIDSAHCPSCGAPDSGSNGNVCAFCGAAFRGKDENWMLHGFWALYSKEAQELLKALRDSEVPAFEPTGINALAGTVQTSSGALTWMVNVIVADGRIEKKERSMLAKAARKQHVPPDTLEVMIRTAEAGTLELPEPKDLQETSAWLRSMIVMALANGNLAASEMKLIRKVGEKAGMVDYDIRQLIKKVRKEQLQEARRALKRKKTCTA